MSVDFTKKTWYDGSEGGTPITAAELNRVETGIDDVVTQSNADKTNIDTHLAKKVNSSDGAHGLRYYNSELDYYDDTNEEWVEIQTGGGGSDVIVPNPQYGTTATKDYSVGDYIYSVRGTLGTDILYVVTAPITRSDTLVVDTNIALSTDEGAEVFVANIVSGESGVPPYNIVGLVNSDGTVTRYGSSKDTSDIANRTLTNIQNTTTTEVEYRYQNTGKTFIADGWAYSNSKYITTEKENNVVYALISEDGYTLTSKTATDLTADTRYIYQNSISGAYFAFVEDAPGAYNIFYSTNLTTWTKVILPGSSGDYAQGNYWFDNMNVAKPISFELNGDTHIVISLAYAQEEQQGTTQDIETAIIKVRTGTDFVVTNSNLLSFGVGVNTDCFYLEPPSLSSLTQRIILGTFTSTDGITYTKYTIPNSYEPRFATKINSTTFHIWCADYNEGELRAYSTTDFSTFTQTYVVPSGTWEEHPEYYSYFNEEASVLLKDDTYFLLGTYYDSEHDLFKSAIVSISTDFDENDKNWCDLPNGGYKFNRHSSKVTVYEPENGTDYNILNMSPFTSEVGKALAILDVNSGSGGGSGASSADEVSYDNTDSGLTADNVQDAIDEVLTKETTVTTDSYGYVITDPKNTHVTIPPASLSGTASMAVKSGTQGKQYTMADSENHVSADFYTKSAVDELVSGLHGIPSGGNTNQVLAKNSSSDYDLKWVNQTGGGSGFKIIVTASTYPNKSVTVTESDSGDTVTETTDANGVATFIVSAGTWTATTLVGGATVTLGSVTVGTTSIEYYSNVNFAFHYSENDSSPDSVTYPSGYDNSDWSSDTAYMDYTNDTFHYGNWNPSGTNADKLSWLFPKPCMLKYDGTVDYYLDPNDYTKKADGTASDIANTSYDGNAMMEWGQDDKKIWWKIIPDASENGFTFCVASYQADEDYDCWNHYDCDNEIKDHFYTPIYFGSLVNSKLRSLSGQANSVSTTRQNEIDYAKANNTDSKAHWYTEVYSDWLLQGMLTTLITKSLDSQTKIGKGVTSASAAINTGTMNTKGLFWGSTNGTDGVKCWGMENTWGNLFRAIGGLIASTQTIKVKLTPNNHDGTTATSYNLDGTGYTTVNTLSGSSGYISHMYATKKSLTPATLSGSESTYYCDRCYTTTSANTYYAIVGGSWNGTAGAGLFCVALYGDASYAYTDRGAALSYK